MDTFEDVWRKVKLHVPLADALLCQEWVQASWRRLCDKRPWSWLRSENEIITNDQVTGTVDITRSSATVTGVGLVFAASDVDRQFRVGTNQPIYTITAVDLGLNTATLDRVYGGPTATATAGVVLDAYVTMPADFGRFLGVLDPQNGWQLRWWITEDELNLWDAQRSSTGTPWALVARRLASTTALDGRAQYELWPYATAAKNYPFYYIRRPPALQDSSTFEGVLADRGDLIILAALAEAAEWPGLEDRKNPYFNLRLAEIKRKQLVEELALLELRDEEVYMTWLETVSWINRGRAPIDSRYLQSHDVPFAAG